MSDPLNNYIGRRGTIFFSAVFCFFSVIGSAVTQNWWQLFITRILLGIGMGSKASTGTSTPCPTLSFGDYGERVGGPFAKNLDG